MDDRTLVQAVVDLCLLALVVNALALAELRTNPPVAAGAGAAPQNTAGKGCLAFCKDLESRYTGFGDLYPCYSTCCNLSNDWDTMCKAKFTSAASKDGCYTYGEVLRHTG